jgi:VWFA-related protein
VSKTAILARRVGQAIDSYRRRDGSLYVPADQQEYYGKLQRVVQVLQTSEGQLTKLAEESGGRIYLPLAATDLSAAYRQVADELKSQYLINYVPSNPTHDGRFRAVKIKIADAALRAYSRGGYYAPRDEQTVVLRRP